MPHRHAISRRAMNTKYGRNITLELVASITAYFRIGEYAEKKGQFHDGLT